MKYKFGIGPMSKNVVDACIEFSNENSISMSLIPSRRQIEHTGGYANNWNTYDFANYIRSRNNNIILKRDHGGPNQGNVVDDGKESLRIDCLNFDAIHIDPWKICNQFSDGMNLTKDLIEYCFNINSSILFEIGTEQSIFPYDANQLNELIVFLKKRLNYRTYQQVKYAVIQCGTALKENKNTGSYDKLKILDMISVCKSHDLISKEHNGDYISNELMYEKFKNGLDSINIAPEFAQIETCTYLESIHDIDIFDRFFKLCLESKKWVKWVDSTFDPYKNKKLLINICGHYIFSSEEFIYEIKNKYDIDSLVRKNIKNKLKKLHKNTK
jgi:hypothetical protein